MFSTRVLLVLAAVAGSTIAQQPYYLDKCFAADPEIDDCLLRSANKLAGYFRKGIPELGITQVEPMVLDELSIAIGDGPDGYRATFKDIRATGVSNVTITNVRSDPSTWQFQFTLWIPRIYARAQYRSSGILILVRASGGGDYWGEYEGVKAKVYFRAAPVGDYLKLEQLKMDFTVKDIKMGVENIHNNNAVIQAALNLFINTNAQELLKEMKPDLKKKVVALMSTFMQSIMDKVPSTDWIE